MLHKILHVTRIRLIRLRTGLRNGRLASSRDGETEQRHGDPLGWESPLLQAGLQQLLVYISADLPSLGVHPPQDHNTPKDPSHSGCQPGPIRS